MAFNPVEPLCVLCRYLQADPEHFDLRDLKCKFDVILLEPPLEEYYRESGISHTERFWNWDDVRLGSCSSAGQACAHLRAFQVVRASHGCTSATHSVNACSVICEYKDKVTWIYTIFDIMEMRIGPKQSSLGAVCFTVDLTSHLSSSFSSLPLSALHVKIMKLEIEEISALRSFVFLWCGSGEGLDLGRMVCWL